MANFPLLIVPLNTLQARKAQRDMIDMTNFMKSVKWYDDVTEEEAR